MFDKVVLCNQGSSILNQVRSRTLSLESGTVEVLLLGGDKIASNWNAIEVASGGNGLSVSLKEKEIPSYAISSFFSCLSELHVVARCKDIDKPSFGQCHGVLVAVNNQAIILAVSDENIVVNDKLFMTFDVEETNGVLQAKADFDGTITQGIFDKLHDYNTLINKPTIGAGIVKLSVHEGLSVSQGDVNPVGAIVSEQTFNVNQTDASTLYLGEAALRGVTEDIDGQTPTNNVPTSQAVVSYVTKKCYITQGDAEKLIGNGKLIISKVSGREEFSANSPYDKTITFGTAADVNVVTVGENSTIDTVADQDNNLITLGQAKTLTQNATSPKTATVEGQSVVIPVGSLVWLAINFIGSVNITMFTTKSDETTDPWGGGELENARSAATYIAKLNDHNGDFFKSNAQVPAGYKFRTLNAMEVTGESMPSYGFALCMCIEAPTTADPTTTEG